MKPINFIWFLKLIEEVLDKAEEAAKNPHDKVKVQAAQNALQNAKKPMKLF